MQHFHFALRAVGNKETQGIVLLNIHRRPFFDRFRQRTQLQNVFLQLVQQGVGAV
ncbi:hypothetical protein D3C80_1959850 [compost metagenome]